MTLFFNINKVEVLSKNDPVEFINILKTFFYKKIPKTKYAGIKLYGNSFLLNANDLFKSTADILFKIQYIKLAAKRDYFLYKQYGKKDLPLSFFPDINLKNIKYNPLLNITKDSVIFKYE